MEKTKVPILEVENLNIIRSNDYVIKNANFKIYKGDYIGIVGPNGGGKTTLLLALLGILKKEKGRIRLYGKDIEEFANWEKIAYVSQNAINFDSQFPLSVKELVSLGRVSKKNLGKKLKKEDFKIVDEYLEFMGLEDIVNKRIGQLSGGQKQRVFVAKALVRNPEIIFLDEPVTGIDADTQEKFYKKLSDLNIQKGITILIVSHDLSAVFCRMSRVMCVNKEVYFSNITEELDPNEVLRKAYGSHFHFVFHRHTCKGDFG